MSKEVQYPKRRETDEDAAKRRNRIKTNNEKLGCGPSGNPWGKLIPYFLGANGRFRRER